jgi:hypothetical protein
LGDNGDGRMQVCHTTDSQSITVKRGSFLVVAGSLQKLLSPELPRLTSLPRSDSVSRALSSLEVRKHLEVN